jgi:hypothetical protein
MIAYIKDTVRMVADGVLVIFCVFVAYEMWVKNFEPKFWFSLISICWCLGVALDVIRWVGRFIWRQLARLEIVP